MPLIYQIANNYVEFSKIDVSDVGCGFQIVDTGSGNYFVLVSSTEAIDHVTVESVLNRPDLRWKFTGQNAFVPIAASPWLNPLVQYVSPIGNDANDGLGWDTAKKYGATAYDAIVAAGGGELHMASGTWWHADKHGMWLRGDGFAVPGWHQICPVRIIGYGNAFSAFGYGPSAGIVGGSLTGAPTPTERFNPALWICASSQKLVSVENIGFGADPTNPTVLQGSTTNVRIGWDYQRGPGPNYDPIQQPITSWARVTSGSPPGTATVTFTPNAYPIVSMSRVGSLVTVNFINTDMVPRLAGLMSIRISGTSGPDGYVDGDYTIASVISNTSVTYDQGTGTGTKADAPNTGNVISSGIRLGDRIEVVSSSPEVPSTAYKVTTVTSPDTLVVTDWYGQSPRTPTVTVSNPGYLVLQNRGTFTLGAGLLQFSECQGSQLNIAENFSNGPTVDIGGATDGRILFDKTCFIGGKASSPLGAIDPDRQAWLLMDGGSLGPTGVFVKHARPSAGGVRAYGTFAFDGDDIQADIDVSLVAPPIFENCSNPNPYSAIRLTRSGNTDKLHNTDPDVVTTGMYQSNVFVDGAAETVVGPATFLSGETSLGWALSRPLSPLIYQQTGFWADGRIAGQVPANYRSLGLLQSARFANLAIQDPSGWSYPGATLTTGQPDPFGGTAALHFNAPGGTRQYVTVATNDTGTRHVGDTWVWGAWIKGPSTGLVGASNDNGVEVLLYEQGVSNGPLVARKLTPFLGDGEWQWCYCLVTLVTLDNPGAASTAQIGYAENIDVYRPTLVYVPASAGLSQNEIAEYALTLRHQSDYLQAHMAGTDNGVRFIAHGGIGTNSANTKTVGVASGQLTLLGTQTYIPLYAADGTTIITWIRGEDATVNP